MGKQDAEMFQTRRPQTPAYPVKRGLMNNANEYRHSADVSFLAYAELVDSVKRNLTRTLAHTFINTDRLSVTSWSLQGFENDTKKNVNGLKSSRPDGHQAN